MTGRTALGTRGNIVDAIHEHDLARLKRIHGTTGQLHSIAAVFGGGTWMHQAAAHGNPQILDWLNEIGFDLDQESSREGDRPIVCAAAEGNVANLRWLLQRGVTLDTSASVRNPLFAAIIGRSPECVQMLLDDGIEATVRYTSPTMKNMDAMAFALYRGHREGAGTRNLAILVARHLADGEVGKIASLLEDAQRRARMNGVPRLIRLVPTAEEIARMRWDESGALILE